MTPVFLAFQNAAGETSHVLLPRASPHATTHLPDSYVDSIDLTVFRNDTHSIARLRTFDNYVTLSAVPGASTKVCIHLPSGEQIELPLSTNNETTWFVLLDGAQFTYADLRCSIEFDYDHSISNSMRPPEIPRPPEHVSVFEDSEMITETCSPKSSPCDDSGFAEKLNIDTPKSHQQTCEPSESHSASPVEIIPTIPQTETTHENTDQPAAVGSTTAHLSQAIQPTTINTNSQPSRRLGDEPQTLQTTTKSEKCHTIRRPGEESQVLQPTPANFNHDTSRQLGEASQAIRPTTSKVARHTGRQLGEESQVLNSDQRDARLLRVAREESQILASAKLDNMKLPTRQSGEESQLLQEKAIMKSSKSSVETSRILKKMQVRNTAFVNLNLDQDSNDLDAGAPARGPHIPDDTINHLQKLPSKVTHHSTVNLNSPQKPASNPGPANDVPKPRGRKLSLENSPDVLHPSIPRKRPHSEVADNGLPPSPSKAPRRRKPSPLHHDESSSTDVSTTSTVTANVQSKCKNKRRRSLRSETDSIDVPIKPVICFSSNCDIQNRKRAVDAFLTLGGSIAKDISDADLLCVPVDGGLRKTPKLILAVILGKIIVTENWVVQCSRTGRFPPVKDYQPKDKAREREWEVTLPDALNQGHHTDTKLDQLFAGYKVYLTRSLQDQLSRTSNLEAFVKIGTSMGAKAVRKRLPTRHGPKMIVLGVNDDFDAVVVGRLGFPLYDKDLLTMSALRGRNEADRDEFRIEIPIKEEELSQS